MIFYLNGETFYEGDTLTVNTPELGTVEVKASIQPFSHGPVLGLDLGWIKTPQLCLAYIEAQPTARLSFYTNGMGYTTLQLAFHCTCRHEAHPRGFEWDNVQIDGSTLTAGPARQEKKRVPAPIPPPPPTVNAKPALAPKPPQATKKPKGNNGQTSIF